LDKVVLREIGTGIFTSSAETLYYKIEKEEIDSRGYPKGTAGKETTLQ
jgi:hypothetical protein